MADHGIEALSGGARKDGADRVLLAQAYALSRTGVGAFIVVSNDRRFSQLATLGVLHVLTLDAAQLSSRLLARATSVAQLVAAGGGWHFVPVVNDDGGAALDLGWPHSEAVVQSARPDAAMEMTNR
jgi:hypothetical protein